MDLSTSEYVELSILVHQAGAFKLKIELCVITLDTHAAGEYKNPP